MAEFESDGGGTIDGLPILKKPETGTIDGLPILKKKGYSNALPSGVDASGGGLNIFQPSPESTKQPYTFITDNNLRKKLQTEDQRKTDRETLDNAHDEAQKEKANEAFQKYYSQLPKHAQDQFIGLNKIGKRPDEIRAATSEEIAGQHAMDSTMGKIGKSLTYIGSQTSKGALDVAKGGAWVLNHMNTSLADTQLIPDKPFEKADKFTDFGITPGQKAQIEDTQGGMGMRGVSALGMVGRLAPALMGGEFTNAPKTMFALQGFGQGKSEMDNLEKEGAKIDPAIKDLYILGSGAVNGLLMGDLGENVFGKMAQPLREKIVTGIVADALRENGEKALTGETFKALLDNGAKDFTDKFSRYGLSALEKYNRTTVDMSLFNGAQAALKKGFDKLNTEPVFNQNASEITQSIADVPTKIAPLFAVIGSLPEASKLLPYSNFKNDIVEHVMDHPDKVGQIQQDMVNYGVQNGWTPEEIKATNQHIGQIAEAASKLPPDIAPEKKVKAVQLLLDRDKIAEELGKAQEKRGTLDPAVADIPSKQEQFLNAKVEQANDKLKNAVSDTKTTFSKGVGEEEGQFFKTTNGVKEEISPERYQLENLERTNNTKHIEDEKAQQNVGIKREETHAPQESGEQVNEKGLLDQEKEGVLTKGGEQPPLHQKAIDAVTHGIVASDSHLFDRTSSARFDFEMPTAEIEKAVRDIKNGNYETAPAKKMLSKLQEWEKNDNYPIIEGKGGGAIRRRGATSKEIQDDIDDAKANKIGELSQRQIDEVNSGLKELGFTHQDFVDYENHRKATERTSGAVQQPEDVGKTGRTQDTGRETAQINEGEISHAIKTGEKQQGGVGEYPGAAPRENIRENGEKVREETRGQASGGNRNEPKAEKFTIKRTKAGDDLRNFADKVRQGKISKLGGFRSSSLFDKAWDGSLEAVATAIDGGAKLADAIDAGLKHIKGTQWYKNLTNKEDFEKQYREHLTNEFNIKPEPTGIRHADTAEERAKEGTVSDIAAKDRSKATIEAKGKKLVDEDPQYAIKTAKDIIEKERPASAEEQAALEYHKVQLKNQRKALLRDTDPNNREANEQELARLDDEMALNQKATDIAGSELGSGLGYRTTLMNEDFSTESVIKRATMANAGEKLDPKDTSYLEQVTKRIDDLEEQLAQREQQIRDLHEKGLVDKVNRAANLEERQAKREVTKASLRKEREGLLSELHLIAKKARAKAGANSVPVDMIVPLTKLARNYVLDGMATLSGVVDKLYNDLIDHVDGLKKDDIAEVLKDSFDSYLHEQNAIRLERSKKLQQKRLETLKEQNATGNFEKTIRRKIEVDNDYLKIRAEIKRQQGLVNKRIADIQQSQKSVTRRAVDFAVKWGRQMKLASVTVLGKLAATGLSTASLIPVQEGIGKGLSKLLPRIAKKSTIEGSVSRSAMRKGAELTEGQSVKSLSQAFARAATKGMKDAYDELNIKKGGQSDLSALYGKYVATRLPAEAADFFGHLHSAIKAPIKRLAWEHSYAKRVAKAIDNGLDPTDTVIDAKNRVDAYKDAERAIFMGDNAISKAYESAMVTLENSNSPLAKNIAAMTRILLPFVKVPTNIVLSSGRYAFGAPAGVAQLARAWYKGIDNLKPDEADMILRNLKRGSVGGAALLMGFFNPQNVGGYYQRGEHRRPSEPKAGGFAVFGEHIPLWMAEHPIFQAMQIGATFRRVLDAKVGRSDKIEAASLATIAGIAEHVPLGEETKQFGDLMGGDTKKWNTFWAGAVKGEVVPAALQQLAEITDTKDGSAFTFDEAQQQKRQPDKYHGFIRQATQTVETGVPGLRETVNPK